MRRIIAILVAAALVAVGWWVSVAYWNGFFFAVAAFAVVMIWWPELPGRIDRWIDS